jgi:hypothetical protein
MFNMIFEARNEAQAEFFAGLAAEKTASCEQLRVAGLGNQK